jgi:hypothetical protein
MGQIIITTYHTLVLDFVIKDPNVDPEQEIEWLIDHGLIFIAYMPSCHN